MHDMKQTLKQLIARIETGRKERRRKFTQGCHDYLEFWRAYYKQ